MLTSEEKSLIAKLVNELAKQIGPFVTISKNRLRAELFNIVRGLLKRGGKS